jgi:RNA methyltransferase, TrmH family
MKSNNSNISKTQIKLAASLGAKKNRDASGLFIAEGFRCIKELYDGGTKIDWIATETDDYEIIKSEFRNVSVYKASLSDISRMSQMSSPSALIAVCKKDEATTAALPEKGIYLLLDGVQDPGNFGSIIRTADWFGITAIICSENTADVFSPKVVQATMGAITRVKIYRQNIEQYCIEARNNKTNICGTFLEGQSIYKTEIPNPSIIILGNEGTGISKQIEKYVDNKLFIPPYPQGKSKVESLNVGVAAAIICAEYTRRQIE